MSTAAPNSPPVILGVAYTFAPVGPHAVGGAEVVFSHLEAALPSLGFRSVVVAQAGSRPVGTLYPTPAPTGEITDAVRAELEAAQQRNIDRALAEHPVALVHMHGLDFHQYKIPADVPVLVTLHLPSAWYPDTIWSLPPNFHLVCVSETQRQACPPHAQSRLRVLGNGVPLPDPATLRPEGHYAVMLARICEEKNLHTGLDAARLAGIPALLAGEVFPYPAHQHYFAEHIQPRLTQTGTTHQSRSAAPTTEAGPSARFLGPVTGPAKARLLARARCLLLPSLAPETSSLVAMEAFAAGIPVIATAVGAVPEIVEHGRTGFLVQPGPNMAAEMAAAIAQLPTIDRATCRATAEQRFALEGMLHGYAALYRTLARPPAQAHPMQARAPQPTPNTHIEHLTASGSLDRLTPDWLALWAADPVATPFQHPAWLLPWWSQFGPDGDLHALTLRGDAGALLAFLPVYTYRDPATGTRQLLLLGAGTTDYLDGLFAPHIDRPTLAARTLHTVVTQLPWDTVSLTQLRPASPLVTALTADSTLRATLTTTPAEPCSLLNVAEDLPARLSANLRRYRRRAEALGTLTITLAITPSEALDAFAHLVRLHGQRWETRGEPGVLADPRVLAHHHAALPSLLEAGLLRLFTLSLTPPTSGNPSADAADEDTHTQKDTEILGVLYALADPPQRVTRSLYLYLIGINPQHATLSPGSLLLHAVWDYARAHGFTTLDLLRGGETYKTLWGATPSPTQTLTSTP